eukprot:jgi/Pico_ML_1/53853/g4325.t2
MAAKEVAVRIRLLIPAGQAKPSPPVGPALGQAGLNIMAFCKEFNAKTAKIADQAPIPVEVTAFKDKSFTWEMRNPPVSYYVKKMAGIAKGSSKPGQIIQGNITLAQIKEIAAIKQQEPRMKHISLESISKSIMGSCRSMGVQVTG